MDIDIVTQQGQELILIQFLKKTVYIAYYLSKASIYFNILFKINLKK